jgi:hypothetical protein
MLLLQILSVAPALMIVSATMDFIGKPQRNGGWAKVTRRNQIQIFRWAHQLA